MLLSGRCDSVPAPPPAHSHTATYILSCPCPPSQLYVNRLKKDMDDGIRWTVDEQRSWQLQMHDERNDAAERAAELDQLVQELTASLERVRSTTKSGLLQQVAELQSKVRACSLPAHPTPPHNTC